VYCYFRSSTFLAAEIDYRPSLFTENGRHEAYSEHFLETEVGKSDGDVIADPLRHLTLEIT
jgi:hypothetical protein